MTSNAMHTGSGASLLTQMGLIAHRNVIKTLQSPASVFPVFIFPLILLAINSAGLEKAPMIPGFPADSYLDFALVVPFMQGCLFATTTAGLSLARDIESGFLSRLSLTPMSGAGLVAGQLSGAVLVSLLASIIYVITGFIVGVDYKSGVAGIALLILLSVGTALMFASMGAYMALRTGVGESVQGLFPLFFAALFLSSMSMPVELMDAEWFKFIAQWNPVTYCVDGLRSLIITGWDFEALGKQVAVITAMTFIGLRGCSKNLRTRMGRT